MINVQRIDLTTDGAGDATVAGEAPVFGKLLAVEVAQGDLAATADITVKVLTTPSAVNLTLLTITNSAASAWYFPRTLGDSEAGAALTGWYVEQIISGHLSVTVAQGGATKSGSVFVYFES